MKHSRRTLTRVLSAACAVGLLLMTSSDVARTQVVTGFVGIDPLSILDLQIKPNVLIVFDTSGSMRFPSGTNNAGNTNNGGTADLNLGGDDANGKMFQAKDALTQVLTANATKFNFGFGTYGQRNATKRLDHTNFNDGNGNVGSLTYVSVDANADTWTGPVPFFTRANGGAFTGTSSANVFNSFLPFNEVYSGPGCAVGTDCRRYLFSRLFRNNVVVRFDTASGSAGLQSGYPQAYTCPKPPAGVFPQDPNVDADPTKSDIQRPCFRVESTAAGNPGADFFFSSGTWEFNGSSCDAAAVLDNVAPCATDNTATIKTFLKPELPIDGSCGDTVGIPCRLTPWENVTASSFRGTNPSSVQGGNPDVEYGIISAQATPLGAALANVRANFTTYFPNVIAGQRNFVMLLTDGDDTCGPSPVTEALTNWNNNPRIETLVIGFGQGLTTLNQIARNGSGQTLDAFSAANTSQLVDALNSALSQTSIAGEFADQQTITESVYEYVHTANPPSPSPGPSPSPSPTPLDPYNPRTRYNALVPLLLQSTFEMPGFVGHVNAFRNNGGVPLQVWDAADMLCRRVTGFPATTGVVPARCDVPPLSSGATTVAEMGNLNTYSFDDLIPTHSGAPSYAPTAGRIKRRIFTTTRNGVFEYGADVTPGANQQPSDGGAVVPLWPPSKTNPGVDPLRISAGGGSYPAGALDDEFGLTTMTLAQLQTTFGACRSGGDTLPGDCTAGGTLTLTTAVREARQMILAHLAGAQVVRSSNGIPRRLGGSLGNAPNGVNRSRQIRYTARTWILADATLSGPAVVTPPVQSKPGIFQPEYDLMRDGPHSTLGTPNAAPGDQITLGYGLRNPDLDQNSATAAASQANLALKPVMTVVYHGANDMLHAFRAGPQCSVTASNSSCATGTDTGGEELWGFVPYDQLFKIRRILLEGQDRANHKYLFATAVRVGDVFVKDTLNDPNGVSRAGRWRVLLFVGRGIGGKHYTGLDVTNPGVFTEASLATRPPLVLWNRGNPDTQDGTPTGTANSATDATGDEGVNDGTAYSTSGQTWSTPALSRVNPGTSSSAPNFGRDFMLFAGSGYSDVSGEGNSFYSIDPLTGDVLTSVQVTDGTSSSLSNKIVANPAVFSKKNLSFNQAVHPAFESSTRVYVGDLHGQVWKFLTDSPGTAIRFRNFGVAQPIANAVALLNYNGDGSGEKPHIFVETGNDRRIAPAALPGGFLIAGLRDPSSDTDTTPDTAQDLFVFTLPDRFRGTVQPATAFNASGLGRVFMAFTRFNPVTATNCQSSFDSVVAIVGAATGNAVYDLNVSGAVDQTGGSLGGGPTGGWGDRVAELTGQRVNAVQVAFGAAIVDTGLQAQNPPPPPAPPMQVPSVSSSQVFVKRLMVGSPICR